MKKKWQKNKKTIKKKIFRAIEVFVAGTLLTAGGNMVDTLSEDSSPHITASEVTWTQDQGKALFEIKTVQRDSRISGWGISGYIMLALGMIILAFPMMKALKWFLKSCEKRNGTNSINDKEIEGRYNPTEKYSAVIYTPASKETEDTGHGSKPSTSMNMLQDKLEQEISVLTKELRKDE